MYFEKDNVFHPPLKAEAGADTAVWVRHLRRLSRGLGYWRRRRNATPHIMLRAT